MARGRWFWIALSSFGLCGCLAAPDGSDPSESSEPQGTAEQAETKDWACYSPQPGHPTTAEKTAWITKAAAYAKEAEATYGVPAAAILSMTANEGGFGWTRTAQYANNAFGYKWVSSTGAGGRSYYVLSCQPSWDPNNKYVKFSDARDGILFVSSRLALSDSSWANYKAVTDRYKRERASGLDVVTAVNHWIDGIADAGYNYDPATYKQTLKKTANNYMTPSTSYSSTYNLYQYSASTGGSGSSVWVSIDSPRAGATVSSNVAFSVTTGGGTVSSVKFFSRASGSTGSWYQIATDSTSPYGITWSTNPWVTNGTYDLKVEVYNGTTKVATETESVRVAN